MKKLAWFFCIVSIGLPLSVFAKAPLSPTLAHVMGQWNAKGTVRAFRSFELLEKQGVAKAAPQGTRAYQYRAVRKDGRTDRGVFWFVDWGKDEGELHFESRKKKFENQSQSLSLKIWFNTVCSMSAQKLVDQEGEGPAAVFKKSTCPPPR